jgi:amidase
MPSAVSPSTKSVQELAIQAQAEVHDAIPPAWKLSSAWLEISEHENVTLIPPQCGLLTPTQIEITEQTATELLAKLATGELSSVEVTEAFCIRAALAHQLVNPS